MEEKLRNGDTAYIAQLNSEKQKCANASEHVDIMAMCCKSKHLLEFAV